MLRKLVPILLALAMVFSMMTACGKKKVKDDDIGSIREQIEELPVELDDNTKELLDKIDSADTGSTAPAAPAVNFQVTVDLPEGWVEKEDQTNIAAYEKETNMVNVMAGYAPSEVKNVTELAAYEREQIKEYFEDAVFSEVESYQISGMQGAWISMEITIGKTMKQTQSYVYFEKGGKYYKIMIAYFSDDEQGKKDTEAILASMKIE